MNETVESRAVAALSVRRQISVFCRNSVIIVLHPLSKGPRGEKPPGQKTVRKDIFITPNYPFKGVRGDSKRKITGGAAFSRHPGESRGPETHWKYWIPAFAGMTNATASSLW
jgi:hypothetical protein